MNPFPPPTANRRHPRLSSASPPVLFPIFYFLLSALSLPAQEPLQILERGPNHARVQRSRLEFDPASGRQIEHVSTFTELADGLSYYDSELQTWAEAREEIELTKTGAVARRGQHQVVFSSNANDPNGALDILVHHQVRLRASLLALRYFNPVDGRAVVLALVQDAQGEWLPPNQIIYRNVFDAVNADLVISITKRGVESDVVLREVVPAPEEFGMPSEVARLEVVTEFFNPPQPVRTARHLATVDDPALRAIVAEPDWIDEELDFGPNKIGPGRAFAWSSREAARGRPEEFSPVGKRWIATPDRRQLLVESVEYISLFDELLALSGPKARLDDLRARARAWAGVAPAQLRTASLRRWMDTHPTAPRRAAAGTPIDIPARRLAQAGSGQPIRSIQLAAASPAADSRGTTPGLVIDWTSVTTGTSDFTFRGDETYYLTGTSYFTGTTRIEGGTVIKFPRNTNAVYRSLNVDGTLLCLTSAYRPAVFTADDDNTVGELIVPGTPNLTNDYAWRPLGVGNVGPSTVLEHLRFKFSEHGIYLTHTNTAGTLIRHCQFVNVLIPVRNDFGTLTKVQNCLLAINRPSSAGFYAYGTPFNIAAENITLVGADYLLVNGTLGLTNSLLIALASTQPYSGAFNYTNASSAGIFQPSGDAGYYLPAASSARNAGTTNLSGSLPQDLRLLTTTAPSTLSGHVTADTVLGAQTARDTDLPALGYHYPPIDFTISGLAVTNATLTLTNGVSLAVADASGLILRPGARLQSEGLPTRLNRLVRAHAVMEGLPASTQTNAFFDLIQIDAASATNANRPSLDLRFTEFSHLAAGTNATTARRLLLAGSANPVASLALSHCQIRGLYLDVNPSTAAAGNTTLSLTNNQFESAGLNLADAAGAPDLAVNVFNNLLSGGFATLTYSDTNAAWTLRDNLFAPALLSVTGVPTNNVFHNGFRAGLAAFGHPANNRTNLALDFVAGPLGRFYYPTNGATGSLTNLLDAGSRAHTNAALFHFTVKAAAGTKEGLDASPTVDIGFHYVGVDAAGLPLDKDGDGLPDYLEDRNGNGAFDAGETDWQTSNSGLSGGVADLLLFTPLR